MWNQKYMFVLACITGHAKLESISIFPLDLLLVVRWDWELLYLSLWWAVLELQFLFKSVGSVWNGVCKNWECSFSESLSWLSDKPTFSLLPSWCCSQGDCAGFASASCHTGALLTSCRGKICSSSIWSALLLMVWDKVALWRLLPKYCLLFYSEGDDSQFAVFQPGRACRSSSFQYPHVLLSSAGMRSLGGKLKEFFLSPSYIWFMFWNTGYKLSSSEYLTLVVKYTTFLDFR